MIYLLNSLPNSILIPEPGDDRVIKGISEDVAALELSEGFTSAIGHQSTADVLSKRLGMRIEFNRIQVAPVKGDTLIVAAFTPNRRLNEGELFSEEEILNFDIRYCKVVF